MRIAVMGAGGIGGNFGARLAAAGEDVALIARGAHLAAIRERGLRALSATVGDVHVRPRIATDVPGEVGPVDVVLLTTKLYDLEAAAASCKPLLAPDTPVISLLNGVDSEDRMIPILGPEHVVGGVSYVTAHIVEPGVVQHVSGQQRMAFGELDGGRSARLDAFDAVARAAGIETIYSEDIRQEIWRKFALLAGLSGVTAVARAPLGDVRADPELKQLMDDAIEEVLTVARARGIGLDDDSERARIKAYMESSSPDLRPSMLVDLEAGKRLEVEGISGAVVRLGREHGVATPINRTIWAALRPYANGRDASEQSL
jgi:2-dehydropantoate 2-reductase